MAITEKQQERIDRFKAAFKSIAAAKNKGIRWTQPKNRLQTRTSLAAVDAALDLFRANPNATTLKGVTDAMGAVPPDRQAKYKLALEDLKKELDQTVIEAEPTLNGTLPVYKVKKANGKFGFRTEDDQPLEGADDLSETRAAFVQNVMSDLTALSKKIGFQIDDMKGLIEKIISDPKNGATSDKVAGSVWEEAMKRIEDKVLPAIKKDLSKLKSSGLIPEGAVLKGIKFSGSDFHKGGNQVLFLRFEEGGKEKKIAYKPSSLMVDSLLFGQGGVASKLGAISTYNIVAAQSNDKPPKDLGYGYMEFVDTQGGPQTGQDVMKVYKSTAAAMAMSYYAGLEDVHNENVLLKKDSVQVIDMEATTGMFPMPQGPHQGFVGGFIDQQWNKAINDGLKKTLISAIQAKKLTSLPKTADIEKEMVAQFEAVLTKMQDKSLATDLKALEQSLAGQRTRIVPIETRAFQDEKEGMIVLAQKPKYPIKGKNEDASFDTWKRFVEENLEKDIKLEQGAKPPETLFKTVRATTTTPLKTLRNLLVSKGVYNALRRGDVPYYYRDLGSSDVFDEEDNKIDATGHKKVGIGIAKEMETRRAADTKQIVAVFKAQAVRMVNDVNNSLAEFLKAVPQG